MHVATDPPALNHAGTDPQSAPGRHRPARNATAPTTNTTATATTTTTTRTPARAAIGLANHSAHFSELTDEAYKTDTQCHAAAPDTIRIVDARRNPPRGTSGSAHALKGCPVHALTFTSPRNQHQGRTHPMPVPHELHRDLQLEYACAAPGLSRATLIEDIVQIFAREARTGPASPVDYDLLCGVVDAAVAARSAAATLPHPGASHLPPALAHALRLAYLTANPGLQRAALVEEILQAAAHVLQAAPSPTDNRLLGTVIAAASAAHTAATHLPPPLGAHLTVIDTTATEGTHA